MLSIGRFAKLANVSPRTVRYYESIGLIASASRGDNNYRYYENHLVDRMTKIKELQDLGFSLDEIKDILKVTSGDFAQSLQRKLLEVDHDLTTLRERRQKLSTLLSVTQKIDSGESINDMERKEFMDAIHEEILCNLKSKHGTLSESQLNYLKRDRIAEIPEQRDFIAAMKRCMEFAKREGLRLGPARGSASASMVLYSMGLSNYDPSTENLYPERLGTQVPNVHIDVEFERGQAFVDFCREETRNLKYGQIQAFKMPLIDIIQNVDKRLGTPIDYYKIDDNSDAVLAPFRRGSIEKIFCFDMSEDALVMAHFEHYLPGYKGLQKITEYVQSLKFDSFRDIINIISIWRPHSQEMVDLTELYKAAKAKPFAYECLAPELQESLKPNHGLIIFHEDILRIVAYYTNWDIERCNRFRQELFAKRKLKDFDFADFIEFKKLAPEAVTELVLKYNPTSFCLPHSVSYSYFCKATAVLQNLHRDIYFEEIEKWEKKHGFRWDDIGVAWKGVSLLQN